MVFTYIKVFSFVFFVISSSKCGFVLFVILYGVWFVSCLGVCLQIQSIIWASTLQIRKHEYFGDLYFIILFVVILPLLTWCCKFLCRFTVYVFSDVCIWYTLWILFCFCKKINNYYETMKYSSLLSLLVFNLNIHFD